MTIATQLETNASENPKRTWLTSPETGLTVSWGDAATKAREIAGQLADLNLNPGAPVAIASQNCLGSCLAFAGITYGGHMVTPLNLVAGAKVLSYVIGHSGVRVILVSDEQRALVEEALKAVDREIALIRLDTEAGPVWSGNDQVIDRPASDPNPDSPALLMYTSGTTGNPKGAVLSHRNLLAAGRNVVTGHGITADDTTLCVLPIYHINGLCVSVMGSIVSCSGLVMPYRFSVRAFWSQVTAHQVSWFSAVPTLFAYLLNDEIGAAGGNSRLRFARSASAPLSPTVHRQFEDRFGIPIIETMGLTETGAQILSNPMPPAARKIGSPGIAIGNEIVIADDSQTPVPPGVTGEILVRGDNVMQGYLDQPEETERTITRDGWLRTGDLGHMDDEGFVFVTGRIKELIIKGGENIAPREVDEALLEHEAVLEAAAFAVDCNTYGQRVEAGIRFKDNCSVSDAELRAHCQARLGKFKSPDRIHILDDLPKGPSGKIQRLKLAELVLERSKGA
ncbi:MAG: AMP-binding protein [Pseudomonadota bacterium]